MSLEINKPTTPKHWIASNGELVHIGITDTNQVTTTGFTTLDAWDDEDDFLNGARIHIGKLPRLPDIGEEVSRDIHYRHVGKIVRVRQTHRRTSANPETAEELFKFHKADKAAAPWIRRESVFTGTVRKYQGVDYVCLVTHETQKGLEPLTATTLWQ